MDIEKLKKETLDKCQEYYDELEQWLEDQGFIWLNNNETGQLMLYTRGKYQQQILEFIRTLK